MDSADLLTVGEVADRSGFAASALRYYERVGLIDATRTSGGQRRYRRSVLRRLAFVRAARNIGLSLDEVAAALATLPDGRTPTKADWARLSRGPGGRGWTSRSTAWSRCGTGWTRASAAAACRCAGAPSPTPPTWPPGPAPVPPSCRAPCAAGWRTSAPPGHSA